MVLLLSGIQSVSSEDNIFHWLGVFFLPKSSKLLLYVPWGGTRPLPWGRTRPLPQGCTIVSWLPFPCFCISSLQISNCLNLPFEIQGRPRRLNEAHFLKTRNGGHRKLLCPGTPQGPAWLQSLLHRVKGGGGAGCPRWKGECSRLLSGSCCCFFFCHTLSRHQFLDQGRKQSHSSDNTRFLTAGAPRELLVFSFYLKKGEEAWQVLR